MGVVSKLLPAALLSRRRRASGQPSLATGPLLVESTDWGRSAAVLEQTCQLYPCACGRTRSRRGRRGRDCWLRQRATPERFAEGWRRLPGDVTVVRRLRVPGDSRSSRAAGLIWFTRFASTPRVRPRAARREAGARPVEHMIGALKLRVLERRTSATMRLGLPPSRRFSRLEPLPSPCGAARGDLAARRTAGPKRAGRRLGRPRLLGTGSDCTRLAAPGRAPVETS